MSTPFPFAAGFLSAQVRGKGAFNARNVDVFAAYSMKNVEQERTLPPDPNPQ